MFYIITIFSCYYPIKCPHNNNKKMVELFILEEREERKLAVVR